METLKAEKRDPAAKAKKLRREGFVTGVLVGKEFKESLALQFAEKDALRFIKSTREGGQAQLEIDGEKKDVLVKNIDYDAMNKRLLALDFQALVAGEKVSTVAQIRLLNEDSVAGVVEQELSELHYKADPAHLLGTIEIDLKKLPQGTKKFHVSDLKLPTEGVSLVTPADALIFNVAEHVGEPEEETSAAEDDKAKKTEEK